MKSNLRLSSFLLAFLITGNVFAQGSVVVRGETSPGVYQNIGATSGALKVTNSGSTNSDNIIQFGGNNIVTGTGVGGVGIPRVTVSSDSFPTTQPISGTITVLQTASSLWVTGTAAVNTGVTVTLPAVSGQFHYITSIQVQKLYAVVGVANAAGNIITTTNLPGNPAWTTEQLASVAGTVVTVVDLRPTTPIKSSVVNTATTIVTPVQLQTIWRINVTYYAAP